MLLHEKGDKKLIARIKKKKMCDTILNTFADLVITYDLHPNLKSTVLFKPHNM